MDFDVVVSGDEQCVPQKVNAPVPADPQPMLPSTPAPVPSVNDPTICERCVSAGLLKRSANTPPHSDIEAKRAHRRWVITRLAAHPRVATAAILLLDDRLPTADATGWSYLTDDILASEDAAVAAHQIFSPNVKADVIADLRTRGVVHTELGCACLFIQRYAPVIRDHYGGAVLAFLDVWGGYARGARPLLELSLSLRLLDPRGSTVTFAASDYAARYEGRSTVATYANVERDAQRRFRMAGLCEEVLDCPPDVPIAYRTMQVHAWSVAPR
jgi:hypothetical protein